MDRKFIQDAYVAAGHSNCIRRAVGAVLVVDGSVVAAGWNGVQSDYLDCADAGCPRCLIGGVTGIGYETCICIHAEQKAIAEAARLGIAIAGAALYVNLRPCLQCLSITRNAGISEVYFAEEWIYADGALETIYGRMANSFTVFTSLRDALT